MRQSAMLSGVETIKDLKDTKLSAVQTKNCSFEVNIKLNSDTSECIFVVINENDGNHEVKALGKIKNM
eukprot:snap_masked-scaffold_23-processed-gene-5.30-mRNA-1 protein AED:1.00 eAED:1.00 QI:0/-1/0/0/-1/1/1/0/67